MDPELKACLKRLEEKVDAQSVAIDLQGRRLAAIEHELQSDAGRAGLFETVRFLARDLTDHLQEHREQVGRFMTSRGYWTTVGFSALGAVGGLGGIWALLHGLGGH